MAGSYPSQCSCYDVDTPNNFVIHSTFSTLWHFVCKFSAPIFSWCYFLLWLFLFFKMLSKIKSCSSNDCHSISSQIEGTFCRIWNSVPELQEYSLTSRISVLCGSSKTRINAMMIWFNYQVLNNRLGKKSISAGLMIDNTSFYIPKEWDHQHSLSRINSTENYHPINFLPRFSNPGFVSPLVSNSPSW